MTTLWIIESVNNPKFPYRLTIRQDKEILLALRVQDKWPGQKGNVFCIREEKGEWEPPVEEIERVPVITLKRFGKRLVVVLDRTINKRCDFLFLTKKYKTREGEYEQIFWRTQQGLIQRRPKVKLTTYHASNINILIDKNEKYAWRFPGCNTERVMLPIGDYALSYKGGIIAVVERKTFDNLLAEFGRMSVFHQQIAELTAYKHAAVVIEANYSDFLNPQKMKFYKPSFAAKAIGEMFALHQRLNIVFAGNRKLANEWTYRFFDAINSHENDVPHEKISEIVEKYVVPQETYGGVYFEIKRKIIEEFPKEFTISMIKDIFPEVDISIIKRAVNNLEKEGVITRCEMERRDCWKKIDN